MRTLKAIGLATAFAALGAASVTLPALAGSEAAPTVTAENAGINHYWRPPTVTVAPGGTVQFQNPGEVPHGIRWAGTPGSVPSCSSGVPVGTTASASGSRWSGSCTFAAAGTYTYYCTVHGAAMSGTIIVGGESSGPGSTTTGAPTTTTGPSIYGPEPPGPANPVTVAPSSSGPPGGGGATTRGAGGLQELALRLHGGELAGSVRVERALSAATLTVTVRARLGGRSLVVGRLSRRSTRKGVQRWQILLSARARTALRGKRKLKLTVEVTLSAPGSTPVRVTRAVRAGP